MLASIFMVIWPIGMPLLFAVSLQAARNMGRESLMQTATLPLSREYDKDSYYWEVIELVRRLWSATHD